MVIGMPAVMLTWPLRAISATMVQALHEDEAAEADQH